MNPPAAAPAGTVREEPERSRYVLEVDDRVVGVADYERRDGARLFTHTYVPPEERGKGYATRLISGALEMAAATGERIVPVCSFVVAHLREHPAPGS